MKPIQRFASREDAGHMLAKRKSLTIRVFNAAATAIASRLSHRLASILSVSAITLLGSYRAQAANATWTGTSSNTWGTTTNWTSSPVPGSGNTATFSGASGNTTVSTGAITIDTILFDTASAAAYTLGTAVGTGTITLNDSGAIIINSLVATNQVINANITLGTTTSASSYSFTNNSGTNGQLLTIAGNISSNQVNATRAKTLTLGGSANGLVSGIINGNSSGGGSNKTATVSLLKSGTGTWKLSNANTYSGSTTISAGTLAVGAAAPRGSNGALGNATSAVILGDASTLVGNAPSLLVNGAFTVARAISVGSLINTVAYNATIGGSNTTGISTYSGAITLNTTAANYTTTLLAATGGTVDFTGTWTTNNKAITIGSDGNTGTIKLSNTLATTGGININFGTFLLGASNRIDNAAPVTVAGGALDTSAFSDTVSVFNMSSGSLNGTGTITAGTYGLSGGTVNANLGAGTMIVTTGNTHLVGLSGATAVNLNSGILSLNASNRLADAAAVSANGGTLAIGNFSDTVGAVSLVNGSIIGSGGTLTGSGYAVQSGTVSAKLGGAGTALTKSGSGTVTLSGANTYTGSTTINGGTLELTSIGTIASTNIIVGTVGSTGAILDASASGLTVGNSQVVSGIGTIKGSSTIQGILAPGNSAGILNNLGNIDLQSGSSLEIELGSTTPGIGGYDQLNVIGSVTLGGLLSVTTGVFTPTHGDLFFIIADDGMDAINGVFSNAPVNGSTYTFGGQHFTISYFGNSEAITPSFTGGNDVVLMAVPESHAALIGGIGVLFLLRRRRA